MLPLIGASIYGVGHSEHVQVTEFDIESRLVQKFVDCYLAYMIHCLSLKVRFDVSILNTVRGYGIRHRSVSLYGKRSNDNIYQYLCYSPIIPQSFSFDTSQRVLF